MIEDISAYCADINISEFFKQISRSTHAITTDDLYSFTLRLPVIFSSADTETLRFGFQINKAAELVTFDDFCRLISLGESTVTHIPLAEIRKPEPLPRMARNQSPKVAQKQLCKVCMSSGKK